MSLYIRRSGTASTFSFPRQSTSANAGSSLTLTSVGQCFYSTPIATLINQTGFSVISSPTSCNDLTIWTNANCASSDSYPNVLGTTCTNIQITPYVSISATSTCPAGSGAWARSHSAVWSIVALGLTFGVFLHL